MAIFKKGKKKSNSDGTTEQLSLFSLDFSVPTTPKAEVTKKVEKPQPFIPRIVDKIITKLTNYIFSPDHDLYPNGAKAKCKNNIEAIKLVKQLESENRHATPEEQITLARYVGWGGLADALTEGKKGWEKEYIEIHSLLSEKEFKSAQESTITAFFTEHYIIQSIYKALDRFGFKGGNILEPSCGVGNFFSVLPENMRDSQLYGVELDDISGVIAKHLYPNARIEIKGYEDTELPDQFFDVAIGNIPFNDITVQDSQYDKYNFKIHDYFIAKTLDKVRPGGIIAFITSKGTLDKKNQSIREYIAQRADLIGAIRLPNTAFKTVAGTSATADIIFLKKHESTKFTNETPTWVSVGETEDGIPVNTYFIENPDMMLGKMKYDSSMYGSKALTSCHPKRGADLEETLSEAIAKLKGTYIEATLDYQEEQTEESNVIPATDSVKNYSYTLHKNEIYYRENSKMYKQIFIGKKAERMKGLIQIHETVRKIITLQKRLSEGTIGRELFEAQFSNQLQELNYLYDMFVRKFGFINSSTNTSSFSLDSGAPLIQSIEDESKDEKDVYVKGTFFFKPTIHFFQRPTSAENADEALKISLNVKGRVDLNYMAELCSKHKGEIVSYEDLTAELGDKLYLNPELYEYHTESVCWETADKYLSGKVKDKLEKAIQAAEIEPDRFERNVKALKEYQPTPLLPDEISFILGSTWIPAEYYREFMFELFEVEEYLREDVINLEYSDITNVYRISGKSFVNRTVLGSQVYGTERINGLKILEESLNLRNVEVKDLVKTVYPSGATGEKYVLNKEETLLAREKQTQIKIEFENWLFSNPKRRDSLTQLYNERFNNIRPREYNGDNLLLPGMNEEIKLEKHQRNVVAHGIFGEGNLLMAQEVGAGKTYSSIATVQELTRLGIFKKPLFVVPNHLLSQWAKEYMTLYPNANILVATKKDLEKKRRRRFVSRIATGNFDAILIAHSSFELINMSPTYRERILDEEISEIMKTVTYLKAQENQDFSLKQAIIFQKKLEAQYEKLMNEEKKDDTIYFEELGVDMLIVDEAHAYKNNFTYSKLQNVAGLGNTRSQRAMDMFMKVQYLNEKNDGRGVIYLTGTPVSNSMSELHVIQKTLQPKELKDRGVLSFDSWASTFGRVESSLEIKPEGNGYQLKNRFSRFHNIPELMSIFSLIADIKTSDMLDLPTPDLKTGKPEVIKTEITDEQQEIVIQHGERAELIRNGAIDSTIDNFLKLTMEARLNAIDPRILDSSIPYNPNTKLNVCAAKVAEIYHETAEQRLTQIVFCDQGTPKDDPNVFTFYGTLKDELLKHDVKEEEIVFIHSAKTDVQRLALFEKVITGEVRILIGSTNKMGTGVNVQNKLIALHHLDIPWRPADLTQRNGRILRRGNENKEISIFNYITADTFDSYLWQSVTRS